MSDTTTMPFQPGTVATAPDGPDYDESTGNKRALLVLALLGGLAVLLIAAYFLLFSGGDKDAATTPIVPPAKTAAQPSAAPSTATKTATVPKISKKNFGTDPFKALLADAPASSSGGTTGSTTAGTTAGTTADTTAGTTTDTTSGSTVGTTTDTTTGTTAPAPSKAYHFRVISVSDGNQTIDVKVDGKSYNGLKAGQVFAKIFKVRYIGGNANAFQIGDEVFNVVGTKAVNISS